MRQLCKNNGLLSATAHSMPASIQQHYLQKISEAESCCLLKSSNSYYRNIGICHVKETDNKEAYLEKKHIQKRHSSICLISLQISHSLEFKCMIKCFLRHIHRIELQVTHARFPHIYGLLVSSTEISDFSHF